MFCSDSEDEAEEQVLRAGEDAGARHGEPGAPDADLQQVLPQSRRQGQEPQTHLPHGVWKVLRQRSEEATHKVSSQLV